MIIDDKYFNLEIDLRFPLTVPVNGWQNFNQTRFIRPKNSLLIYLLKCNDCLYVGSDKTGGRIIDHKGPLIKNKHDNSYMQALFNKYGIESFFYYPLVEIPEEYQAYRDQIENAYIKLFNTFSGRNIKGLNLAEFAFLPMLGRKHKQSTKDLLSERFSGVKKTKEQVDKMVATKVKTFTLCNPNGELVTFTNMREFCRNNNLTQGNLIQVANGISFQHKGWRLPNEKTIGIKIKKIKPYIITAKLISPTGEMVEFTNMTKFCNDNNLGSGNISMLIHGKIKSHKGWTKPKE